MHFVHRFLVGKERFDLRSVQWNGAVIFRCAAASCGLVDPGAQAAAAATLAVFSVDASGNTLLMPFEGCV